MVDDLSVVLEAAFRREWPVLVGVAARITGNLARAEEIAQDVMVTALDRWPFTGVPDRPGAWLVTATRNRARNVVRDDARAHAREQAVARAERIDTDARDDDEPIGDDRLRLLFVCCHSLLADEAQIALTLRMVGGLSTAEIARAFVVPRATMAQRLVRAKRAIADAGVPFVDPEPGELRERLPGVLAVVYLMFNEGYSAAGGEDLMRPVLCAEALRLASLLVELLPREPEVHGLLGLVRLQSARLSTRCDSEGDVVLLPDQDRARWDTGLLDAGRDAIERALEAGPPGPMTLQAMIAACHVGARSWSDTEWPVIVALYDALVALNPSPIVRLNRAVAVSFVSPHDALDELDALSDDLATYSPWWAARADVLRRLGLSTEAAGAYRHAATLGSNEPERRFLLRRADECAPPPSDAQSR